MMAAQLPSSGQRLSSTASSSASSSSIVDEVDPHPPSQTVSSADDSSVAVTQELESSPRVSSSLSMSADSRSASVSTSLASQESEDEEDDPSSVVGSSFQSVSLTSSSTSTTPVPAQLTSSSSSSSTLSSVSTSSTSSTPATRNAPAATIASVSASTSRVPASVKLSSTLVPLSPSNANAAVQNSVLTATTTATPTPTPTLPTSVSSTSAGSLQIKREGSNSKPLTVQTSAAVHSHSHTHAPLRSMYGTSLPSPSSNSHSHPAAFSSSKSVSLTADHTGNSSPSSTISSASSESELFSHLHPQLSSLAQQPPPLILTHSGHLVDSLKTLRRHLNPFFVFSKFSSAAASHAGSSTSDSDTLNVPFSLLNALETVLLRCESHARALGGELRSYFQEEKEKDKSKRERNTIVIQTPTEEDDDAAAATNQQEEAENEMSQRGDMELEGKELRHALTGSMVSVGSNIGERRKREREEITVEDGGEMDKDDMEVDHKHMSQSKLIQQPSSTCPGGSASTPSSFGGVGMTSGSAGSSPATSPRLVFSPSYYSSIFASDDEYDASDANSFNEFCDVHSAPSAASASSSSANSQMVFDASPYPYRLFYFKFHASETDPTGFEHRPFAPTSSATKFVTLPFRCMGLPTIRRNQMYFVAKDVAKLLQVPLPQFEEILSKLPAESVFFMSTAKSPMRKLSSGTGSGNHSSASSPAPHALSHSHQTAASPLPTKAESPGNTPSVGADKGKGRASSSGNVNSLQSFVNHLQKNRDNLRVNRVLNVRGLQSFLYNTTSTLALALSHYMATMIDLMLAQRRLCLVEADSKKEMEPVEAGIVQRNYQQAVNQGKSLTLTSNAYFTAVAANEQTTNPQSMAINNMAPMKMSDESDEISDLVPFAAPPLLASADARKESATAANAPTLSSNSRSARKRQRYFTVGRAAAGESPTSFAAGNPAAAPPVSLSHSYGFAPPAVTPSAQKTQPSSSTVYSKQNAVMPVAPSASTYHAHTMPAAAAYYDAYDAEYAAAAASGYYPGAAGPGVYYTPAPPSLQSGMPYLGVAYDYPNYSIPPQATMASSAMYQPYAAYATPSFESHSRHANSAAASPPAPLLSAPAATNLPMNVNGSARVGHGLGLARGGSYSGAAPLALEGKARGMMSGNERVAAV